MLVESWETWEKPIVLINNACRKLGYLGNTNRLQNKYMVTMLYYTATGLYYIVTELYYTATGLYHNGIGLYYIVTGLSYSGTGLYYTATGLYYNATMLYYMLQGSIKCYRVVL